MASAFLEHVNITATDPVRTAQILCTLFDWKIRWQGDAIHGGKTVHVGEKNSYIAVYKPPCDLQSAADSYETRGGLNHLAIVVDDLDKVEKRVIDADYKTYNHGNYEPGRRFYFRDENQIEFEIVSYDG